MKRITKISQKSPDLIEYTKIIENDIYRGSRLISNVQKFSLIEENKNQLMNIKVYDIQNNLVENYYKRYPKRSLDIKLESDFTQIKVQANAFIEDVFDNLLFNAIKHNDSKKIEILIRVSKVEREGKKYFKFEFMDNGKGVKDDQKKNIFFRSDDMKRQVNRSGIGLSLVKNIIDSYNGLIWVENRVKDDFSKGSTFIVLIPEVI